MPNSLKIKQVQYPAKDAITLRFDKINAFANYLPGQHLFVSAILEGKKVARTYSFCTSPYLDDDLAVTVRRLPEGLMSEFLIDQVEEGMELELEGPFGEFTLEPNPAAERHLVMFAGGSGITPLMSMLRSVLYEESGSIVSLIYANRSFDRIIFYRQLQDLQEQFPDRFKIYHALLEPEGFPKEEELFYKGELNRLVIKKMIKNFLAEHFLPAEFYLCGPYGYMEMANEALTSLNIPNEKIFKEHFFVPEQAQESEIDFSSLPERAVAIKWKGETISLQVPSGKSILEAALEVGLDLPHSCKQAQCGTCRSLLLQGEVKMKHNHILTTEELEKNQVLLCQGYAMTDDVAVRPLDQPT